MSSLADPPRRPVDLVPVLLRLADATLRPAAAGELAARLGAEELLVFVRDPEVGEMLPARGLPQRLREGRRWKELLESALASGEAGAVLFAPGSGLSSRVRAFRIDVDLALVLVGGGPFDGPLEEVRRLLPLLAPALRLERSAIAAQNRAGFAQEVAERARTLATALDGARRDLQRALTQAQEARQRAAFLAEAGVHLSKSLDSGQTLAGLARLAVPRVCDACIAEVASREAPPSVWVLPEERSLAAIEATYLRHPTRTRDVERLLLSGAPWLVRDVRAERAAAGPTQAEHLVLLERLGVRSAMFVPVIARGEALGLASFFAAATRPPFGDDELALAEELARRAALALDNARLFREAQRSIQAREEFLSVASHELRGPLTTLKLGLHVLQRALQTPEERRSGEFVPAKMGVLIRQTDRLSQLIAQLLDVTRLRAGPLTLRREPVDLTTLLREQVERLAEEAARARCEILLSAEEPLIGCWDRLRIEQVITNLLSNAIKYGRGAPIEVLGVRAGLNARLTVRDRGIGIAPEDLPRIFDRFERSSAAQAFEGLGLGLYIARQLVEAHHGSIQVSSQLGEGTTFTVELPLAGIDG